MNRAFSKLALSVLILFPSAAPSRTFAAPSQSVIEGNTAFAFDLYAQVANTPGNVFYSPYSISSVLALTYVGAHGNTEKQIGAVLHWAQDKKVIQSAFVQLQSQLTQVGKQSGIELNIANALWTQKEFPFLPAFIRFAKNDFQADVNQVDFGTEAAQAIESINAWVDKQTKGRINDILAPGCLNQYTRLVLANAVYFKSKWAAPFPALNTSVQPFHVTKTEEAKVPLMHEWKSVKYTGDTDLQAVELLYSGNQFSMLILLPRQVQGLKALEQRLTPALVSKILNQMKEQDVELFVPRFKLESVFNLASTLTKMGMPEAFSGAKADFSGMDGQKDLFISALYHKAWGEVNEEGTEAAAATVAEVYTLGFHSPPPPKPVFRADHPFLFFIRDVHTGSLLFVGRLAKPSSNGQ